MSAETIESAAADAVAAPLDLLLTDAALGALNRVNLGGSGLRLAAALAARPRLVASRTRNLLGELARIAAGTSQVQPSERDRRFADPGWAGNPLLRRAMQAYLASAQTAEGLAQEADLDWSDTERVGFVLRNPDRRAGAEQQPGAQPGGTEGSGRRRRRQRPGRPTALRRRHGEPAAGAVDGGAGRVQGRSGSRGHTRGGGGASQLHVYHGGHLELGTGEWSHFITVRKFVDEEVVPVIGGYWERAEIPHGR